MGYQYALVAKKAASLLGCLRRAFPPGLGDEHSLLSALVRPQLECRVQFWAPQYRRGIDILDSPVNTAEMVKELGHLQYEETRRDGIVQPGGGIMRILLMCMDP